MPDGHVSVNPKSNTSRLRIFFLKLYNSLLIHGHPD